jgi:hypothetical protein
MYLASTDKIQVVLSGAITTVQLPCVASWQDITSAGMTLPQSSSQTNTNSATAVDLVAAPASSTNRQVTEISIYNADSVSSTVTVQKDVSATDYIIVKALLQVGDTLMYSRDLGWKILSSSSQESILFTAFTSSGTWTKDAGLKRVLVTCVGAGGGSGSGRQGLVATNRFGGGGGGGGAVVWRNISASDLTSTVTVTVGAGGTAGASQVLPSTNGNAGGVGGDTSFGAMVIAKGGSGGGGGSTTAGTAGAGGQSSSCTPAYGAYAISGSAGAAGNTTTTAAGGNGFNGSTGASGGGGGGGINSANTSGTAANTGGNVYQNGILIAGPVSGASPNGVDNQSVFLSMSNTLNAGVGLGTGGAGNNPANVNGGSGGNYGAGAGGGSGTLDGTASGAGAVGGGGLCIVMEIY